MKRASIYERLIFLICLLSATLFVPVQTAWFADGCHGDICWRYSMSQARLMVEKRSENSGESIICQLGYGIDKNLKHSPKATLQTYSWGMDFCVPGPTSLHCALFLHNRNCEAADVEPVSSSYHNLDFKL